MREEDDIIEMEKEDELYHEELAYLKATGGQGYPSYYDEPAMAGFPQVRRHRQILQSQAAEALSLSSGGSEITATGDNLPERSRELPHKPEETDLGARAGGSTPFASSKTLARLWRNGGRKQSDGEAE